MGDRSFKRGQKSAKVPLASQLLGKNWGKSLVFWIYPGVHTFSKVRESLFVFVVFGVGRRDLRCGVWCFGDGSTTVVVWASTMLCGVL